MNKSFATEAFSEIMHIPVITIERVQKGISLAEKYHIWTDHGEYLIKITPERCNTKNYELLKQMHETGLPVNAAIAWKYFKKQKQMALIFNWINGENLEEILNRVTKEEKIRYGEQAGMLLKQFHTFNIETRSKTIIPYYYFQRYRFCLQRYRAIYPHMKEMNQYVQKKKNIFKKCERISMIHQDFRPENILVYQGNLYLTDFETVDIADPYSDFSFCINMQPDEFIPYSIALIKKYFDDCVPEAFWEWTCFYAVLAVQKYAIWKYRQKKKMVKLQAEHLFSLYSEMQTEVPLFWRESIDDH